MSKTPSHDKSKTLARTRVRTPSHADFDEVIGLIEAARVRAVSAVNKELIDLYWNIGGAITRRIAEDGWGQGTVQALADHIQKRHPGMSGFSAQNLWRMRQFCDAYHDKPKLSALLRELSWTHNLLILGKCKHPEEREFYLRLAQGQKWSSRELERQITGALFERSLLHPPKLSAPLRDLHPEALSVFRE